jgi:hypothetical protein
MITPEEEEFIARHAYVPEHLPGYGKVFSGGEPFLLEGCLCFVREGTLIFVGYPLNEPYDEKKMRALLPEVIKRFHPFRVALMAPSYSSTEGERKPADHYYRLDLGSLRLPSKVKNMIHRAARELRIEKGRELRADHRKLIDDFLARREVEEGTRMIFSKIGEYLSSVSTARIFDARDSQGRLAGFDVADFGARDYAFYLFNFPANPSPVPGTSDLLLHSLILEAQGMGKSFVNLGLGINDGVAFFKKKWGGEPFLRHEVILFSPSRPSFWESIFEGMMRR